MSPLRDEQLRRLLAARACATGTPEKSLSDVARLVATGPQRRSIGARRGGFVIAGLASSAALAVVAFLGGTLVRPAPVVGPPSSQSPGAVVPSEGPSSVVASTIPASPETRPWTALTWTSGGPDSFESDDNTTVMGTIANGDGFVAVGHSSAPDGADVGRVWLTDDGRTWRSLAPPALDGLMLRRIVRVEDRLVVLAVKRATQGEPQVLAVVASPDGIDWVPVPAPPVDADRSVSLAVGGPLGILVPTPDRTWFLGPDLAEWTSVVRTDATPDPARGGLFAAGHDRWFWLGATGSTASGSPPTVGAIWWSIDGTTWNRAVIDRPGGVISEIHRVDGGYVALGTEQGLPCDGCRGPINLSRVASFSSDGSTWTRLDVAGAQNGDPLFAAMVSGDGDRLVVFANRFLTLVGGEPEGIATTTIDGRTWSPVTIDVQRPRQLTALTVGSHGVVGFDQVNRGSGSGLQVEPWWGAAVASP